MPIKDKNKYAIQAVENTLCVLEAISEETGDFGASHIGKRLGLSRSYIFRVLATFEKRGYVQQSKTSNRYRTGLAAYKTGSRFLNRTTILQKSKQIMKILAKNIDEAVYLAIPSEKDLLFLELADSTQKVRIMSLIGKSFPLDQFSAGKVIQAYTAKPSKLTCSQQAILNKGACIDHGAVGEGIVSLSVPILNIQGLACGSLCLLMPEFRLNPERIEKILLPQLISAGEELSAKLGHIKKEADADVRLEEEMAYA